MKRNFEPPDSATPTDPNRAQRALRPVVIYDDREPNQEMTATVTDFPYTLEQAAPPAESLPAATRPRRARSLFWPGFATSFLLLSMLSCGGLAMATGLNRIDLQNTGPAWEPPPEVTPVAEAVVEASAASVNPTGGSFQPGEIVRILTDSRLRRTPGYQGKDNNSDVVTVSRANDTYEIVEGPQVVDNLNWWFVRYTTPDGRLVEGWAAETSARGVQILGKQ